MYINTLFLKQHLKEMCERSIGYKTITLYERSFLSLANYALQRF